VTKTLGGVRVRGDDLARWRAAAAADGRSLSEWVRRRLDDVRDPVRDPRLDPRVGDVMRDAAGEVLAGLTDQTHVAWVLWTVIGVRAGDVLMGWMDSDGSAGQVVTTRRVLAAGWTTLEAVYVAPDVEQKARGGFVRR